MSKFIKIEDEKQAIKLVKKKYLPNLKCPKCNRTRYVRKLGDRYWCKKCRYKFSLKISLGFKYSKLTIRQILKAIYCFSEKIPLKIAQDLVEVSYPSIRRIYSHLRKNLPRDNLMLGGDIIVDECFVGKRRNNNQSVIIGAVNREFDHICLEIIENREQGIVEKFLTDNVLTSSLITTDGFLSYIDIEWYGYGHRIEYHDRWQLKYSSAIERVWALLKTMLRRIYHHVTKEKLSEYLQEFIARFNYKEIVSKPSNLLTYLISNVPSA